jgi:hypothetical protein
MTTATAADLSDDDRAALALAIEVVRNESAARREQIDEKLPSEAGQSLRKSVHRKASNALVLRIWTTS